MDLKKLIHDARNDIQVIMFGLCNESTDDCRRAAREATENLLNKLKEVENHASKR